MILGVQDLRIESSGPELDWMGSYAAVGEVPIRRHRDAQVVRPAVDAKGCEDTSGCLPAEDAIWTASGRRRVARAPSRLAWMTVADAPAGVDGGCSVSGGLQSRAMGVAFLLVFSMMRRRERTS